MGKKYPCMMIGAVCSLLLSGGCVWLFPPPEPGPEAVLAGTWLVEQERDTVITELYWVFDSFGHATEVRYKWPSFLGDVTVTDPVESQETTVNGDEVTVRLIWGLGWDSTFEGTLNAEQTEIEGRLTLNYQAGADGTKIEIDQGNATLIRQ